MKKLFLTLLIFVCGLSSQAQKKEFSTLEFQVANRKSDTLIIYQKKENSKQPQAKIIRTNKEGIFKDTVSCQASLIFYSFEKNSGFLYLKPGKDLVVKFDAKNPDQKVFSGKLAKENTYLNDYSNMDKIFDFKTFLSLPEAEYQKALQQKISDEKALLDSKKLDPEFVALQKPKIDSKIEGYNSNHEKIMIARAKDNAMAPDFEFENLEGGKTKLSDFRGKFVYIDIWATWCGFCLKEMPDLKKLKEEYKDKNIVFVCLSVDKTKDREKVKNMIKAKEMDGIQLLSNNEKQVPFLDFFIVPSIPRFILIDPNGKVVKATASRPHTLEIRPELDAALNNFKS